MTIASDAQAALDAALAILAAGPRDLREHLTMLERAASLGSGEAVARLCYLRASGVDGGANWDRDVEDLRKAAQLGWAPAEREFGLIAGAGWDSGRNVDIRQFVAPRPTTTVSESPRIRTIRGFMSAEECGWIIERGKGRLGRAEIYDNNQVGSRIDQHRSNSGAPFTLVDTDLFLILLRARIGNTIGLPSECCEPPQLLHYAPGESFQPHYDFLDPAQPGLAADLAQRGQRVATFLVYLNDGFDGGETEFCNLGFRFKGATGDALVFANVSPALIPDPRTLHAGLAPTRGEKWLLSQWIRNRPQS